MKYKARLTIYSNTNSTDILDFKSNSKGRLLSRILKTVKTLNEDDTIMLGMSHNYIRDGLKYYEPCYPFLNSMVEIFTKEELIKKIKDYFNNIIFLD